MKNHTRRANSRQFHQIAREIAFSSDLLALQASVAAPAAGAHVMELAVAADEVRQLARLGERAVQQACLPKQEQIS